MKNLKLLLAAALLLPALNAMAAEDARFAAIAGISSVPKTNWSAKSLIADKDLINYDFDATALTTYDGMLTDSKLGLSAGASATVDDNLVGKLYNAMGYVGIKTFMLRVQTGKLTGKTDWTGPLAPGQIAKSTFDNKYTNVDLLKWSEGGGGYWGVGYTSLSLPLQVETLTTTSDKSNQRKGTPVYDQNAKIKYYCFMFGFDTLVGPLLKRSTREQTGFGFFFSTQDRFGAGSFELSETAQSYAQAMNPGKTPVSRKMFALYVDYDLALGPKYTINVKGNNLVLAAGYNVGGSLLASIGGGADNPREVGYEPSFFLFRHGPMVRAYLAF